MMVADMNATTKTTPLCRPSRRGESFRTACSHPRQAVQFNPLPSLASAAYPPALAFSFAMKLISLIIVAGLLAGCSGVQLNSEYSTLLDQTAALSAEAATRAEANQLSPADAAKSLRWNADAWQKFRDGRDGKKAVAK